MTGIGKPGLRLKAICGIYKISAGMIAKGMRGGCHRNYIINGWNLQHAISLERKKAIEEYLVSQGVPAELARTAWQEVESQEDEIVRLSGQAGIVVPDEKPAEEKLLNMGVCMLRRAVREHFSLHSDPFQPRIDDKPFKSRAFLNVFSAVQDALELRAMLGICGTTGSGKSVLWTALNQELSRDSNVAVAAVRRFDKNQIRVRDIYMAIMEDLTGEVPRAYNQERTHRLVESLLAANATDGINTVLLVNEAHDLSIQAMIMLKRLWETFNDSPKLGYMRACTIILLGQEGLESFLRADRPELREVAQRADLEHYGCLAADEVGPYLRHRFAREDGAFERIYDPSAIQAMTRGTISLTPQIVNVWASNALYTAFMVGAERVTAEHVGRVLQR